MTLGELREDQADREQKARTVVRFRPSWVPLALYTMMKALGNHNKVLSRGKDMVCLGLGKDLTLFFLCL